MHNIFGINLRRYRELRGLSQKELADLLSNETGNNFTQRHISNYEKTDTFPKAPAIPFMAKILDVSIDSLFGLTDKMNEVDISQYIGITRPELNSLSKVELKATFEKYLNILDELVKSSVWHAEKVRSLEEEIKTLRDRFEQNP